MFNTTQFAFPLLVSCLVAFVLSGLELLFIYAGGGVLEAEREFVTKHYYTGWKSRRQLIKLLRYKVGSLWMLLISSFVAIIYLLTQV